ncbi:MAG TPA: hypothetical protein VEF72_01790 [Mycobacterium sp.]|jgi:hypothetical protein|nr:hypothetical protein [Mycobacterium sp.]
MQSAVRCCITVGVALGGVGVIVAAPAAPPLPDIQVPAIELSVHDSLDVAGPSVGDLLQVMNGVESPGVVVQNITESDTGSLGGDQPSNVPGLSELLNLGGDPAGANVDQLEKALLGDPAPILQAPDSGNLGTFRAEIGRLASGDLGAMPASPSSPGG